MNDNQCLAVTISYNMQNTSHTRCNTIHPIPDAKYIPYHDIVMNDPITIPYDMIYMKDRSNDNP